MHMPSINFANQPHARLVYLRYGLLLVGVAAFGLAWMKLQSLQGQAAAIEWQINSDVKPGKTQKYSAEDTDTAQREISQARQLLTTLNTPWDQLFQTIESAYDRRIILTSVAPSLQQQSLQIKGLATNIDQAILFANKLKKHQVLWDVYLTEEAIETDNPAFPLMFNISAKWRAQ